VNLWREWARLELSTAGQRYQLPSPRHDYAGLVLSLARQEWPDTSGFTDPEIAKRIDKRHHVGLVVRSPDFARVQELLARYAARITDEFLAILPPLERPT
jgi:hypothetical protein